MRTTFTTATFASHHALNRAQTITRKFGLAAAGTLSILFAARRRGRRISTAGRRRNTSSAIAPLGN
jgi:hypothetical protein